MKNVTLFRTTAEIASIDAEHLAEALAQTPYRDLHKTEVRRVSFVPPLKGQEYATHLAGYTAFSVRFDERKIPAAAVRSRVARLVEHIERVEGRRVSRAERANLKEQVYEEIVPGIPPITTVVDAYIDRRTSLIVIVTSSRKRAEDALDAVRMALGSLKVVPLHAENLPSRRMTEWLRDPDTDLSPLVIGNDALLEGYDDSKVSLFGIDMESEAVAKCLADGMTCTQLAVSLDGEAKYTLSSDLRLLRIDYSDDIYDQDAADDDDPAVEAQATFIAQADTIYRILSELDAHLKLPLYEPLPESEGGEV